MEILTFTTLYPSQTRPQHGIFVETRLRKLVESGAVDARVMTPCPWFPFASFESESEFDGRGYWVAFEPVAFTATTGEGLSTNMDAGAPQPLAHYAATGICDGDVGRQVLQPVNADGSSVWKQGRTVPVKRFWRSTSAGSAAAAAVATRRSEAVMMRKGIK